MDFRVYVDGISRIICDLNDQTTIHDIIIALAQYKNQPGRYSLFERRSDGQERTLSPNLLALELQQDFDSVYILRQNSSPEQAKRSKSVDDRPSNGIATTSTIVESRSISFYLERKLFFYDSVIVIDVTKSEEKRNMYICSSTIRSKENDDDELSYCRSPRV